MLERLHFILGNCVGEGTEDSDCIVVLNYYYSYISETPLSLDVLTFKTFLFDHY